MSSRPAKVKLARTSEAHGYVQYLPYASYVALGTAPQKAATSSGLAEMSVEPVSTMACRGPELAPDSVSLLPGRVTAVSPTAILARFSCQYSLGSATGM